MAKLTAAKARAAHAAITAQWQFLIDEGVEGPQLILDWTEAGDPVIVWEGEGPYDWTHLVHGGTSEDLFGLQVAPAKLPAGVFAEPYNHCVLALYPA